MNKLLGISLVEILISLVLIGIIATSYFELQSHALTLQQQSQQQYQDHLQQYNAEQ